MVEETGVQQIGFHNLLDQDGKVWGFQFGITTRLYRGMFLSQFRTGKVTVDGVVYPKESLIWNIQGIDYTAEQMYDATETYWQLDEPAYIKVPKPGGLEVGHHDVKAEFGWINVYGRGPEKEADGSGFGNAGPGEAGVSRRLLLVW